MATSAKISVTHGDAIVAAGLRAMLSCQVEIMPDGSHDAPVVVTDYAHGMALLAERSRAPAKVLVVAGHRNVWELRQAMAAGVHGYVLQSATPEQLLSAVQALQRGAGYISPGLMPVPEPGQPLVKLTRREEDVLRLLAKGYGNKLIARELDIGIGTVKAHNKQLFNKLGATTRTQAVVLARRQGLISA